MVAMTRTLPPASAPSLVSASVAAAVVASGAEELQAVKEPMRTAAIKSASICFFIIIISSSYIYTTMHKITLLAIHYISFPKLIKWNFYQNCGILW